MKKFVVVDQSLDCFGGGHHFEYSLSVCGAAKNRGYESFILANNAWAFTDQDSPEVIPWFYSSAYSPELKEEVGSLSTVVATPTPLREGGLFSKILGSLRKQDLLLTQKFRSQFLFQGSFFSLSFQFRGLSKLSYGLLEFLFVGVGHPVCFMSLGMASLKKFFTVPGKKPNFGNELFAAISVFRLSREDHVLVHTLSVTEFIQFFQVLRSLPERQVSELPRISFVFRRAPAESYIFNDVHTAQLPESLNQISASQMLMDRIKLFCDTDLLVEDYNRLSQYLFATIPIPFRSEMMDANCTLDRPTGIHIVYLGIARIEKGIQFFPKAIQRLYESHVKSGSIFFSIQTNIRASKTEELAVTKIIAELIKYSSPEVSLLNDPLSPENYYGLVNSADLIVIPYLPEYYFTRSSGVFTEALAAGKPVIVPENTWMSSELRKLDRPCGIVLESFERLDEGILEMIKKYDFYRENAESLKASWRKKHSPGALVKKVLGE